MKTLLTIIAATILITGIGYSVGQYQTKHTVTITVSPTEIKSLTLGGTMTLKNGMVYHTRENWGGNWKIGNSPNEQITIRVKL